MGTSRLQEETAKVLHRQFGSTTIKENYRPDWLTNSDGNRIELDFYLPDLGIAIEVNGCQHYAFTPFFHSNYAAFEKQRDHDEIKEMLCNKRGVTLLEVSSESDLEEVVKHIGFVVSKKITPQEYYELRKMYLAKRLASLDGKLRQANKVISNAETPKQIRRASRQIKNLRNKVYHATLAAKRDFDKAIEVVINNM